MQYKQRGNDDQAGALWVGEQEEDLCVCWDVAEERKWAELGKRDNNATANYLSISFLLLLLFLLPNCYLCRSSGSLVPLIHPLTN